MAIRSDITTAGSEGLGKIVSSTGDIRFANATTALAARNAADSADIPLIGSDASDRTQIGAGDKFEIDANGNVEAGGVGGAMNSMVGGMLLNNGTAPTGDPSAGGYLTVVSGALEYRGSDAVTLVTTSQNILGAINEVALGGGNMAGSVTTSDATPVALATFTTTTNDTTTVVECNVTARDVTSGARASYSRIFTVSRNGSGTLALLDSSDVHTYEADATWDITATVSGSVVTVEATGDSTNDVNFVLSGWASESA